VNQVRIELPAHLRSLAGVPGEVSLPVEGPVTLHSLLDALEAAYPMLRGTIREYGKGSELGGRRAFLRFFASEEDISFLPMDASLPEAVATGREPVLVVGAVAGG
jgi:hypothetical protein